MKSKVLGWVVGWLMLAATCAFGDGCVFASSTAFAKVQIPDQRALIHFSNGVETLVIDTAFKGEGTNFAWVVPVPSTPKVEAATSGLFPTLQMLFRSPVEHELAGIWLIAIVAGVILGSLIWRQRSTGSCMDVLAVWFLLLLLSGLILPALGTASSTATSTRDELNIIERKTVGIYDTVTLSSKDGGAVVDWLTQNGFATPTNYLPAIRAYASEGWVFVASKIHMDAALAEGAKPHPLILRFQTPKPVYPLRLTGIGNESCKIDLYVFGAERAEIPNFEVERCSQLIFQPAKKNSWRRSVDFDLNILHPLLRKLVEGSAVATKLTARLTSEQMANDAYVSWRPFAEEKNILYSKEGAACFASNCTVPVVVFALLVIVSIGWSTLRWAKKVIQYSLAAAGVAVIAWVPIFLSLPKVDVHLMRMPHMSNINLHKNACFVINQKWKDNVDGGHSTIDPDLAWIRKQLADPAFWMEADNRRHGTNVFTGQPCREEDSPGNYTIRTNGRRTYYISYDINGAENEEELGKQ
jgi:hypothetical protein